MALQRRNPLLKDGTIERLQMEDLGTCATDRGDGSWQCAAAQPDGLGARPVAWRGAATRAAS